MSDERRRGAILFAHGSRDPQWKEPFIALERRIGAALPGVTVKAAYLEGCRPNIHDVADAMAADGIATITVTPMFLAVGAHSRNDFPNIAAKLAAAHPGVVFTWTDVLGEWDETLTALSTVVAGKLADG
jgi:sirohydrochlorin cobaltochelatase